MRYDYDMLGTPIHQASMEAGERWMLNDVTGKPIRAWDSRGYMRRMTYDALRRPTGMFVTEQSRRTVVRAHRVWRGPGHGEQPQNTRDQVFDGAGVVTSEAYDFKGNLLRSSRSLADDYQKLYDWQTDTVQPTWETFSSSTTYDALNRPVSSSHRAATN